MPASGTHTNHEGQYASEPLGLALTYLSVLSQRCHPATVFFLFWTGVGALEGAT